MVIVIIALLVVVAFPYYYSYQLSYGLDSANTELLHTLRRARRRAIAKVNNSRFGVHFASDSYTLFAGNSYAGRDTQYDEVYDLDNYIQINWSLGGNDEVVFSKNKGKANNTGTITLTAPGINRSLTIEINSEGNIEQF